MARPLLAIAKSPENILAMTKEELAYALLEDMQARLESPINGMANRHHVGTSLFSIGAFYSSDGSAVSVRDLAIRIDKLGRDAFALLERWELAEPADDINGRNGYMVLTQKGRATTERTDFERIRVRGLLREEMLHPLLRGKIYGYFAGDDLGTAVFEAFKTVEIEVRSAGGYPEKEMGKTLMFKAFAVGGPLSKPADDKQDCDALSGLFAGALSRFRNPGAHTNRTFADVLEAMEELMLGSRLLRIVDDRRRRSLHHKPDYHVERWRRREPAPPRSAVSRFGAPAGAIDTLPLTPGRVGRDIRHSHPR
jgi:uncharacterized protein (TIGR02391 family)